MNSRERMIAAIEFGKPDRLPIAFPMQLGWLDTADAPQDRKDHLRKLAQEHPQDFEDFFDKGAQGWGLTTPKVGRRVDEWGVVWHENTAAVHPLADWKALEDYTFPDPRDPGRFKELEPLIESWCGKRYLVGRHMSTLFERYSFLRGFENGLTDHLLYPEEYRYLRDKILQFSVGLVQEWLRLDVDAVYFGDDFGMQDRMLMSPETWREVYRPIYAGMFSMVRDAGKHVMFHSDGDVMPILEDLVEIGVQVLNPVQKFSMDFDELGKRFKGRLVFWGGIDTQQLLPRGTPDEVRQEVQYVIRTLACPEGGYLAKPGHTLLPDMQVENVIAMYEEFINFKW